MFEATKDSIRLLSEATSDAMADSITLAKSALEELYKVDSEGFSQEEFQKDLAAMREAMKRGELASNFGERLRAFVSFASDIKSLLEQVRKKYSDFLPSETIRSYEFLEKEFEAIKVVFDIIGSIFSATDNIKVYSGLTSLSEALEKHILYFSGDGKITEVLREVAMKFLKDSTLAIEYLKTQHQVTEQKLIPIKQEVIAIKNTARAILWQLDQGEKERKFSVGDLLNWLDSAPAWVGDDFEECLDYVNRTRN